VTWTKAKWWSNDEHHNQDLRSSREDPRHQAKSKHEDRNQAIRKITKKRARRSDRTLAKTTGRWTGHVGEEARQNGISSSDRMLDWTLAVEPIERREVASDRVQRGSRMLKLWPDVSGGRWPDAGSVRSVVRCSTVGTTGRVQTGQLQRPDSSRKAGFCPQWLLSLWGL